MNDVMRVVPVKNRVKRTVSNPPPRSPTLQSLRKSSHKSSISSPLVLSSTQTLAMQPRAKTRKHSRQKRSIDNAKRKQSRHKRSVDRSESALASLVSASKSLRIQRKYTDKMPTSPHLNPPQENGYNNDSMDDDEIDDDVEMSDMDDMPGLDIDCVRSETRPKAITVIEPRHIQQTTAPKFQRSRSHAVGLLNNCAVSNGYVGCVITDDEPTTDDAIQMSGPSSAESKKESPFTTKERINHRLSFRFKDKEQKKEKENEKQKKKKKESRQIHHKSVSMWM